MLIKKTFTNNDRYPFLTCTVCRGIERTSVVDPDLGQNQFTDQVIQVQFSEGRLIFFIKLNKHKWKQIIMQTYL